MSQVHVSKTQIQVVQDILSRLEDAIIFANKIAERLKYLKEALEDYVAFINGNDKHFKVEVARYPASCDLMLRIAGNSDASISWMSRTELTPEQALKAYFSNNGVRLSLETAIVGSLMLLEEWIEIVRNNFTTINEGVKDLLVRVHERIYSA
jgi:hypothetical protein